MCIRKYSPLTISLCPSSAANYGYKLPPTISILTFPTATLPINSFKKKNITDQHRVEKKIETSLGEFLNSINSLENKISCAVNISVISLCSTNQYI